MGKPGNTGLRRIINATTYSMAGIKAALRHEAAFRQESVLAAILIPLGIWLGETGVERALLAGVCLLVLIIELVNSAIEAVVDRISDEHHPLAGRAKDMGSATVFIGLLLVVLTWGLVLFT